MNNEFNNLYAKSDNTDNENERKFEIYQLKLEHFYFNENDNFPGTPISTSIELVSQYNFETEKLEWKKLVSHTYCNLDNVLEYTTDTYEEYVNNLNSIVEKIEKIDLKDLKNNYFSDDISENLTYWEITYNNKFKIVGTYDQTIDEYKMLSEILDFKKVVENEPLKIIEKIEKKVGGDLWN